MLFNEDEYGPSVLTRDSRLDGRLFVETRTSGERNPKKVLAMNEHWHAYAALQLWAQLEKKSSS